MYVNSHVQFSNTEGMTKPNIVYEQVNDRWEVAFAMSDGEPMHVSFANSISTSKGGTHVEMIATQLATKLYVCPCSRLILGKTQSRKRTRTSRSSRSR